MSIDVTPILAMSRAEKISLMQLILKSLEDELVVEPSDEQIKEIRETSRLYREGKIKGKSWEEVRENIIKDE